MDSSKQGTLPAMAHFHKGRRFENKSRIGKQDKKSIQDAKKGQAGFFHVEKLYKLQKNREVRMRI